jgi:hypothetical protein
MMTLVPGRSSTRTISCTGANWVCPERLARGLPAPPRKLGLRFRKTSISSAAPNPSALAQRTMATTGHLRLRPYWARCDERSAATDGAAQRQSRAPRLALPDAAAKTPAPCRDDTAAPAHGDDNGRRGTKREANAAWHC